MRGGAVGEVVLDRGPPARRDRRADGRVVVAVLLVASGLDDADAVTAAVVGERGHEPVRVVRARRVPGLGDELVDLVVGHRLTPVVGGAGAAAVVVLLARVLLLVVLEVGDLAGPPLLVRVLGRRQLDEIGQVHRRVRDVGPRVLGVDVELEVAVGVVLPRALAPAPLRRVRVTGQLRRPLLREAVEAVVLQVLRERDVGRVRRGFEDQRRGRVARVGFAHHVADGVEVADPQAALRVLRPPRQAALVVALDRILGAPPLLVGLGDDEARRAIELGRRRLGDARQPPRDHAPLVHVRRARVERERRRVAAAVGHADGVRHEDAAGVVAARGAQGARPGGVLVGDVDRARRVGLVGEQAVVVVGARRGRRLIGAGGADHPAQAVLGVPRQQRLRVARVTHVVGAGAVVEAVAPDVARRAAPALLLRLEVARAAGVGDLGAHEAATVVVLVEDPVLGSEVGRLAVGVAPLAVAAVADRRHAPAREPVLELERQLVAPLVVDVGDPAARVGDRLQVARLEVGRAAAVGIVARLVAELPVAQLRPGCGGLLDLVEITAAVGEVRPAPGVVDDGLEAPGRPLLGRQRAGVHRGVDDPARVVLERDGAPLADRVAGRPAGAGGVDHRDELAEAQRRVGRQVRARQLDDVADQAGRGPVLVDELERVAVTVDDERLIAELVEEVRDAVRTGHRPRALLVLEQPELAGDRHRPRLVRREAAQVQIHAGRADERVGGDARHRAVGRLEHVVRAVGVGQLDRTAGERAGDVEGLVEAGHAGDTERDVLAGLAVADRQLVGPQPVRLGQVHGRAHLVVRERDLGDGQVGERLAGVLRAPLRVVGEVDHRRQPAAGVDDRRRVPDDVAGAQVHVGLGVAPGVRGVELVPLLEPERVLRLGQAQAHRHLELVGLQVSELVARLDLHAVRAGRELARAQGPVEAAGAAPLLRAVLDEAVLALPPPLGLGLQRVLVAGEDLDAAHAGALLSALAGRRRVDVGRPRAVGRADLQLVRAADEDGVLGSLQRAGDRGVGRRAVDAVRPRRVRRAVLGGVVGGPAERVAALRHAPARRVVGAVGERARHVDAPALAAGVAGDRLGVDVDAHGAVGAKARRVQLDPLHAADGVVGDERGLCGLAVLVPPGDVAHVLMAHGRRAAVDEHAVQVVRARVADEVRDPQAETAPALDDGVGVEPQVPRERAAPARARGVVQALRLRHRGVDGRAVDKQFDRPHPGALLRPRGGRAVGRLDMQRHRAVDELPGASGQLARVGGARHPAVDHRLPRRVARLARPLAPQDLDGVVREVADDQPDVVPALADRGVGRVEVEVGVDRAVAGRAGVPAPAGALDPRLAGVGLEVEHGVAGAGADVGLVAVVGGGGGRRRDAVGPVDAEALGLAAQEDIVVHRAGEPGDLRRAAVDRHPPALPGGVARPVGDLDLERVPALGERAHVDVVGLRRAARRAGAGAVALSVALDAVDEELELAHAGALAARRRGRALAAGGDGERAHAVLPVALGVRVARERERRRGAVDVEVPAADLGVLHDVGADQLDRDALALGELVDVGGDAHPVPAPPVGVAVAVVGPSAGVLVRVVAAPRRGRRRAQHDALHAEPVVPAAQVEARAGVDPAARQLLGDHLGHAVVAHEDDRSAGVGGEVVRPVAAPEAVAEDRDVLVARVAEPVYAVRPAGVVPVVAAHEGLAVRLRRRVPVPPRAGLPVPALGRPPRVHDAVVRVGPRVVGKPRPVGAVDARAARHPVQPLAVFARVEPLVRAVVDVEAATHVRVAHVAVELRRAVRVVVRPAAPVAPAAVAVAAPGLPAEADRAVVLPVVEVVDDLRVDDDRVADVLAAVVDADDVAVVALKDEVGLHRPAVGVPGARR